ncbi:MAG: spore gernimation protein [Clostridiales bacterium]|nr:spore gernimation protein [Clostridiales bacterium]
MIKEGKFGPQEAICLVVITIVAKIFYTDPSIISNLAGTAGWYMTLISVFVAAVGFTLMYLLLKRFPGKDIIEIFEITLGRFLGFAFSALLALLMVAIAAVRMREFSEVLKAYVLPLTPLTLILFLFIGTVMLLNILGLETIARLSKLTIYGMMVGFFIVLILGTQNYSIHHFFPILGYGIEKTLYHGIIRSSVYGEVVILAVFAGSLQGIKHIKKIGYTSLVLSGFFISIALLAFILTFPYYVAMEITSPMYEMATLIDYGRFLQRVDPIFLFIMTISSLISVSTVFYAFMSIYCKMFRIQDRKPVILAASIITFVLATAQQSISDVAFGSVQNLRNYGGLFFYMPPLISLIVAKLRKKGDSKGA